MGLTRNRPHRAPRRLRPLMRASSRCAKLYWFCTHMMWTRPTRRVDEFAAELFVRTHRSEVSALESLENDLGSFQLEFH